ncbi:hypothetical protein ACLKA6_013582 [Drosophila palustris]
MSETAIDDVLDLIGFGRIQLLMMFTCSMILIYVNNELMGINLLSISIICDFNLSVSQHSMLTIAAFVGLILSSPIAGYKTDKIGRRTMVIYSLISSLATTFLTAFMPNYYFYLFGRFLTGLGISGAAINSLTYITEYTKIAFRPRVINFTSHAVALGSMYMPVLATFMRPLTTVMWRMGDFDVRAWRLSLLAHCLPGVVAFCCMWLLPETAKFMLSKGDSDGAYNTLNRLCLSNRKRDLRSYGVTSVTQPHLGARLSQSRRFVSRLWQDLYSIISRPYLPPFVQITIILSGFSSVGIGFSLWFTKMRHYSASENVILCMSIDYCHKYNYTTADEYHCSKKPLYYTDGIILAGSVFFCCVSTGLMLKCLNRRVVLTCNAFVAALFGFSLNFIKRRMPQLVAKILFITLCLSSIHLAGSIIMDIVPTVLRGKATALTYMFARIAIIITSLLHGHFMCEYCLIIFNFFVDFLLVVAVLSFLLPV